MSRERQEITFIYTLFEFAVHYLLLKMSTVFKMIVKNPFNESMRHTQSLGRTGNQIWSDIWLDSRITAGAPLVSWN